MARCFIFFFALVVLTQCNKPQQGIYISYKGTNFSFQLESQEDKGLFQGSGHSSGDGFYQATGDLEYILSNVCKGYRYRLDPKWKNKRFDFTLRFSDGEVGEGLFKKVAEEVHRQSGIAMALVHKTVPAYCLKVEKRPVLASHKYQMEGGVEERLDLFNNKLVAEGVTLNRFITVLNNERSQDLYVYEGKDEGRYSFDLNIANRRELERSLSPYGLVLENCQVAVKVVQIK